MNYTGNTTLFEVGVSVNQSTRVVTITSTGSNKTANYLEIAWN